MNPPELRYELVASRILALQEDVLDAHFHDLILGNEGERLVSRLSVWSTVSPRQVIVLLETILLPIEDRLVRLSE